MRILLVLLFLPMATTLALASSPLHPAVELLDAQGDPVLESGRPVSTMKTCGGCHDTEYIASHSYHAAVGADETFEPGTQTPGRPWNFSPGMFGRWEAMRYRRLTLPGEAEFDLGVADWVRLYAARHVGGGPATTARDGTPLLERVPGDAVDPETHVLDESSGEVVPWDWRTSGVVEMNCFLCHLPAPANGARIEALQGGHFRWASTATLQTTGLVRPRGDGTWSYVRERFDEEGLVPQATLGIGDPTPANCGLCHGQVHTTSDPLRLAMGVENWETESKGQIVSPQQVSESAMNLAGKEELRFPWDIHASRLVSCIDCHHSINNPVSFAEATRSRPEHLRYDARRLSIGEYLKRPSHHFAKGEAAQGNVARRLDQSMRRCEDCHNALETHEAWLPNPRRHLQTLLCESCHVPQVHAPAHQMCDWTVLTPDRGARIRYRGTDGDPLDPRSLIEGYEPAILPRTQKSGEVRHGPHNLCVAWTWMAGEPKRPVPRATLEEAYFDERGAYRPAIVAALDANGDGALAVDELQLDTEAKVEAIRLRLAAVGVEDAFIEGCIQPMSLHHNVVSGLHATRACEVCHARDSRMTRPFELSPYRPAGAHVRVVEDTNVHLAGRFYTADDGRFLYEPVPTASGRYVIGHDRAGWIDVLGALLFLGTLAGVLAHSVLRWHHGRKRKGSA